MKLQLSMKSYTTAILAATVFFLFADQNLLAPNLSAIAEEFGFSDEERDEYLGGYIAFGFFIVGGPMALIVGYLADVLHRCTLFGVVVGFGACASLATSTVRNFTQLLICRVLTGISIGGATPIIFSVLGDLYPGSRRIYVSTVLGVAIGSGVACGQLVSGMVSPLLGWRAPFLIMAVPAIGCAVLVFFTVEEPRRGDQEQAVRHFRERQRAASSASLVSSRAEIIIREEPAIVAATPTASSVVSEERGPEKLFFPQASLSTGGALITEEIESPRETSSAIEEEEVDYSEKIEWAKVVQLLHTPSAALIFAQGLPGCLPWGMIIVFLNDFFSHDKGLSVQAATAALTCFGIGGLFGQLSGGWLGQRLYNQDPRLQTLLMGLSTMTSVFPMLYLLNTKNVESGGFYVMAAVAGIIVNMNGPNVKAVLQNVCIPEIRGTAFAVFTLTDDIGKGLGPALVVLLIRGCGGNRQEAFNLVVLFWIICGSMLLSLNLTVVEDEHKAQERVKQSLLRTTISRMETYQSMQYSPNFETTYAALSEEKSVLETPLSSTAQQIPIRNPLFLPKPYSTAK